jgi:TRAP-type transport system small permease protein
MKTPHSSTYSVVVIVGGGALLAAMAVDLIAVIGRHTGWPLLGSIELVQFLVGISGALALIVATVHDSHAMVRLLLANVGMRLAAAMQRINALCAALFLLALAAGSLWILRDMWHGHEESELLRLPLRPLRIVIIGALLGTCALFLRKAWRRSAP